MVPAVPKPLMRLDRQFPVTWLLEGSGAKTVPLEGETGPFRRASRSITGLMHRS